MFDMFQRERHRFPIDIFPKFYPVWTGDVGNQEWTNGQTVIRSDLREPSSVLPNDIAMFHPHQLFTPTVSNFNIPVLKSRQWTKCFHWQTTYPTHGDQHLLFPCSAHYRFRKVPICATFFFSLIIAWIPGAMLGLSPKTTWFSMLGNRFPLPWFPALDQAACSFVKKGCPMFSGQKINDVIICWAYMFP